MSAVPRKTNGHVDWLAYVRTTWPVLVVIGSILFYFGQRMERYEASRVDLLNTRADLIEILQPIREQIMEIRTNLREHETMPSHSVTAERMRSFEERISRLEKNRNP